MRYLLVLALVACSTSAPPEPEPPRPSCDEIVRDAIEIGRQTGIAQERTRVAHEATWRLQAEAAGLEAEIAALKDIAARRAARDGGGR